MKVTFGEEFGDSIKTLIRQNSWWYKTYKLFRYDIPRFIKNIWKFKKALWGYRWWDNHGVLVFMEIGLFDMANSVEERGNEVEESRFKKVAAMRRVVQLIKNYNEHNYIEQAEKELGPLFPFEFNFEPLPDDPEHFQVIDNLTKEQKEHETKVFDRAHEIEEQEWNELFQILKGKYDEYDESKHGEWDDWFDGSGLKGWWD
jgi:hypothetical protein